MRKILYLSFAVLVLGILFKLFHYPGGSIIVIIGSSTMGMIFFILAQKIRKERPFSSVLLTSLTFWTIYFLFRIQFWPGAQPLFYAAVGSGVVSMLYFKKEQLPDFRLTAYAILVTLMVSFSFVRAHYVYYFFNLTATFNGEFREQDYRSWNKYSWFLYLAKEDKKALKANAMAQKAFKNYHEGYQISPEEKNELERIQEHVKEIKEGNWKSFP